MEELSKVDTSILECSIEQYNEALNLISNYTKSNFFKRLHGQKYIVGADIKDNLSKRNLRRSFIEDSKIIENNLHRTGFAGTSFVNTLLLNNIIKNTNFHSCRFSESKIIYDKRETISSSGFHKSLFVSSTLKKIDFRSCGFTDTFFDRCEIIDCNFKGSSFDNATIKDCKIINTDFSGINLDYLYLENVSLENVVFPMTSINNVIGGLDSIYENRYNCTIFANATEKQQITVSEYLDLLPALKDFYIYNEEYFALANIFCFEKNLQCATTSIIEGIRRCIITKNFRLLTYFCKIVYVNSIFDSKNKKRLFEILMNFINITPLSEAEKYNFNIYQGQIKEYLFTSKGKLTSVELSFKTDIEFGEDSKIMSMFNVIHSLVKSNYNYSIKLNRNSPYEFTIYLTENIVNISIFIVSAYFIFDKSINIVGKTFETLIQCAKLKNLILDNKLKEHELENIVNNVESNRVKLDSTNINVNSINYQVYNTNTSENIIYIKNDFDKIN